MGLTLFDMIFDILSMFYHVSILLFMDEQNFDCTKVIPVPISGHMKLLYPLATVNNAFINIYVQVLAWTTIFIFLG